VDKYYAARNLYFTLGEPWKELAFTEMCNLINAGHEDEKYHPFLDAVSFIVETGDDRAKPILESLLEGEIDTVVINAIERHLANMRRC
jgi:hypothetical protein